MNTMVGHKTFARQIGLVAVSNLLIGLSGLIFLPILTKTLSIGDYGIWIESTVTIGLIPGIMMFGLPYAMVRYLAAEKEKTKIQEGFYSIFVIVTLSLVFASIIVYMFSGVIADSLFGNSIQSVKILSLVIFFEGIVLLFQNYFRTFQQIKTYSIILGLQTVFKIILVTYFVFSGYGIVGAVIGLLIADIIVCLLTFFWIYLQIGFKIPKFTDIREYLNFGLPTVPANLSVWTVDLSDRYIIGIFLGIAAVGCYSPGYVLGNIIIMLFAPLSLLLPTVLSKYYDENNIEIVKEILKFSIKYFLVLAIPSVIGLSLLARPILTILSTPEIASQAYMITPFVALSALFFGLYTIIVQILVLMKETRIPAILWIVTAIISLILNFILVPLLGIIGAAITTLITYLIPFIFTTYFASRHMNFKFERSFIVKSLIASIIMALLVLCIYSLSNSLINLVILISVSALVYFIILYLIGGLKRNEISFFKNLLKD
jgi:O-antigen/teichoic acid export membrane protein